MTPKLLVIINVVEKNTRKVFVNMSGDGIMRKGEAPYEAIMNTPTDAIRTFFSSGMDALVIGSYLVEK